MKPKTGALTNERKTAEFFVGSYGTEQEESIKKFRLDLENGTLQQLSGFRGLRNPSWLSFDKKRRLLYAVGEKTPDGTLSVLKETGAGLALAKTVPAGGADPCHIARAENGSILTVSNYTSGSLAVYRLDPNGLFEGTADLKQHAGKSANPIRQAGPHVHFSLFDGKTVYAADLGLDMVFLYEADERSGVLVDTGKRIAFPSGSGPRHLTRSLTRPDVLYAVCELSNEAAVLRKKNGEWALVQTIRTLPETIRVEKTAHCGTEKEKSGNNLAAAIRISGEFLLISNRGDDSISVFRTERDGSLIRLRTVKTGGRTPRDFQIFGNYAVAANQDSNSLTVLKWDEINGILEQTDSSAEMLRPTCICRS